MVVLGYIGILLVGVVLGLLGGGGSILCVPVLVYIFGIAASLATSYSLLIVGITSAVGTFRHVGHGAVDFQRGLTFLIPSMAGIALSRRVLLPSLPDTLISLHHFQLSKDRLILFVFAVVMVAAGLSMLKERRTSSNSSHAHPGAMAGYGLAAGALMGFVGAGGGFLIIPVLVNFGSFPMKQAVGTSLLIIAISSVFGSTADFLAGVPVPLGFLLSVVALSIAGVLIGTHWSSRLPADLLKRLFGWMILVVAAAIVLAEALNI